MTRFVGPPTMFWLSLMFWPVTPDVFFTVVFCVFYAWTAVFFPIWLTVVRGDYCWLCCFQWDTVWELTWCTRATPPPEVGAEIVAAPGALYCGPQT